MKKPAGVPGDIGAVCWASVRHSPSSGEMVSGKPASEDFSSIEAGVVDVVVVAVAVAVVVDVGFWGLGAQNLSMHVSQIRLAGVYARRTWGLLEDGKGGGVN